MGNVTKKRSLGWIYSAFIHQSTILDEFTKLSKNHRGPRAVLAILKLMGPGPYPPKKVVGPGPGFTLIPPKSGGARAQPAHTPTTALGPLSEPQARRKFSLMLVFVPWICMYRCF